MSTQPSALTNAYTCKICRRTLSLTGPPIIGEDPNRRIAQISDMLARHLAEEHKERLASSILSGNQFAGWLIWDQYSHNDAQLIEHSNAIRLAMRRHTQRVRISDEFIERRVDQEIGIPYSLAGEQLDAIAKMFKEMRDALDEAPPKK